MNRARQLLDQEFMAGLLEKEVLPLYPDFKGIKRIKIIPHKEHIWGGGTYHVVVEYRTVFIVKRQETKTLPIFCTAHSSEPRQNVFDAMKFLWDNGFSRGLLTTPRPLFYSEYFRGTFYRGVEGKNLYRYIHDRDKETVERMLPMAARWFAKLHSIDVRRADNFNHENSRIATTFPGIPHILSRIEERYPRYLECYRQAYGTLTKKEEAYFAGTGYHTLVHGDAHPENIIKMGKKKTAAIDFTDLCLSDYARDIGSFCQQLEFMADRKIGDPEYSRKLVKIFKDNYYLASHKAPSPEIEERMATYYHWTMMRTATHFLMKDQPEPERAYPLIDRVCNDLGIN